MIISSLRQLAALTALAAALMHLCIGLKLAVFHDPLSGGQTALVATLFLLGFTLWVSGCRLANKGGSAAVASNRSSVLKFPVLAKPIQSNSNEACTRAAA